MIVLGLIIVLGLCVYFYPPFGGFITAKDKRRYQSQAPYYHHGRFYNHHPIKVMSNQKSQFTSNEKTIPDQPLPIIFHETIEKPSDDLRITWLGHSSFLIQCNQCNICIDPVMSEYPSPIHGGVAKRFSNSPIALEKLETIDIVMISHDHYDHLDKKTIQKIDKNAKTYIVPLGVEKHLMRWGVKQEKIKSLAWWQDVTYQGLSLTAVPSQHFSGRVPWHNNHTLWCGYVLSNDKYRIYFTGDTGYSDDFKKVHQKFGDIDLLLLENGQFDNRWKDIHLSSKEGLQVMKDVHAKWTIPMHWGTFCLSRHSWDYPVNEIVKLAKQNNLQIITPQIGEVVDYVKISKYQKTWWRF